MLLQKALIKRLSLEILDFNIQLPKLILGSFFITPVIAKKILKTSDVITSMLQI